MKGPLQPCDFRRNKFWRKGIPKSIYYSMETTTNLPSSFRLRWKNGESVENKGPLHHLYTSQRRCCKVLGKTSNDPQLSSQTPSSSSKDSGPNVGTPHKNLKIEVTPESPSSGDHPGSTDGGEDTLRQENSPNPLQCVKAILGGLGEIMEEEDLPK